MPATIKLFFGFCDHPLSADEVSISEMDARGCHLDDRPVDVPDGVMGIFRPQVFKDLMALPVLLLVEEVDTRGHLSEDFVRNQLEST